MFAELFAIGLVVGAFVGISGVGGLDHDADADPRSRN